MAFVQQDWCPSKERIMGYEEAGLCEDTDTTGELKRKGSGMKPTWPTLGAGYLGSSFKLWYRVQVETKFLFIWLVGLAF